eukprot:4244243-Pleurochrysis_carterae.AAC.2
MPSEEKVAQNNTVYSSNFESFCNGNTIAFYMYTVMIEHGCLESVTCAMPVGTADSSSAASRQTAGSPPPHMRRGYRKRRADSGPSGAEISGAFSQPVALVQTQAAHMIEVLKVQAMMTKANKNSEAAYFQLSERIDYLKNKNSRVPDFMMTKLMRLEQELTAFEEKANKQKAADFDFFLRLRLRRLLPALQELNMANQEPLLQAQVKTSGPHL